MIASPEPQSMTVEAYLAWEPRQELRHEFVNGTVYATTGGTVPHNDIAVNLLTALRPHVRDQGCRINIADVKVQVTPSTYRYPDLVVSCNDRDQTAVTAIQFPKLIFEILSAGTEARDRGEKFQEYRTIPNLEEYVLVSSTQVNVEIYRRGEGRLWLYTAYLIGDTVPLESLGFELPIAQLYEEVRLPE